MSADLDLSIIIVSYNTCALLRACLQSIERARGAVGAPTVEVIVVDNGSADDSRAVVRREFPLVRLIESDNVGFAAGNNKGITASVGRYLLLLNPDTEIIGDALSTLVRFMDEHPRAGLAGARLEYADGSFQHAAFRFPNLWMTFFDFYNINHRLINSRLNGRYSTKQYAHGSFQIDHPLGACMIVRRSAVDSVGALDEGYFMYAEEIDWCLRMKHAGWEVWHVAEARVIHHAGQSTQQFRHRMFVELHRSRARLFQRHYSPAFRAANRLLLRLGLAREIMRTQWRAARGQISADEQRQRLAAYSEVWRL